MAIGNNANSAGTSALALGNAAYRGKQLQEAGAQYRQATVDHPESGDAWNNLAQVRMELGQWTAAREAAARAVALGGPRRAAYQALLDRIEAGAGR